MSRKYVGFDIETAKVIPEGANLRDERPLGVTCVAFDAEDFKRTIAAASGQMTPAEVRAVVDQLEELIGKGYTIATWNGLAFDFDILAEEAEVDVAKRIAVIAASEHHVDLMFHFVCAKGFRCSLAKACEGMDIEGKTEGVTGAGAPELWASGEREKVLEYVAQDARIQRLLTEEVAKAGRMWWVTKKGTLSSVVLGEPRDVVAALRLPEPDTTWMDNPPQRKWFYWWTKPHGVDLSPDPKVF
jgi:hypothetical protein